MRLDRASRTSLPPLLLAEEVEAKHTGDGGAVRTGRGPPCIWAARAGSDASQSLLGWASFLSPVQPRVILHAGRRPLVGPLDGGPYEIPPFLFEKKQSKWTSRRGERRRRDGNGSDRCG